MLIDYVALRSGGKDFVSVWMFANAHIALLTCDFDANSLTSSCTGTGGIQEHDGLGRNSGSFRLWHWSDRTTFDEPRRGGNLTSVIFAKGYIFGPAYDPAIEGFGIPGEMSN
jgi:hypothetical protein